MNYWGVVWRALYDPFDDSARVAQATGLARRSGGSIRFAVLGRGADARAAAVVRRGGYVSEDRVHPLGEAGAR
jgi:hypothetical protein